MQMTDSPILLRRRRLDSVLSAAIGLVVYLAFAFPLKEWIIDDAGISYAYARSLALGYGLVAQPGGTPVEGFSNLAWILTLVPAIWLKLFDPIITPKIVAALFVAGLFYVIDRIYADSSRPVSVPALVIILLLATNISFVVWTTSGLENALLALLVVVLIRTMMRFLFGDQSAVTTALLSAVIIFLIQLTRPEGIAYFIVFPLVLGMDFVSGKGRSSFRKAGAMYFGSLFLLIFIYVVWRYNYFGDYLSNTFRAKGGPNLHTVISILTMSEYQLNRLMDLTRSVLGSVANIWLILGVVVTSTIYFIRNQKETRYIITLFMALLTAAIYLLLPNDWMGEYRFATPFFVFYYAT